MSSLKVRLITFKTRITSMRSLNRPRTRWTPCGATWTPCLVVRAPPQGHGPAHHQGPRCSSRIGWSVSISRISTISPTRWRRGPSLRTCRRRLWTSLVCLRTWFRIRCNSKRLLTSKCSLSNLFRSQNSHPLRISTSHQPTYPNYKQRLKSKQIKSKLTSKK